ncbi:MAG: putative peptidoglycan glycosyltransferase FtsW [Candidatus Neptunochlamydia sp.]|nr:putative peptidoglycan glycosyltransferase FtsW [Candidatus Neptunochlamydia sp.]
MRSVYFLLSFVTILFAIGILMVFDTTSAEVIDRSLNVSTHHALIRQLVCGCLGVIFALLVYFFGYKKLLEFSPYLFYGCTTCLFLVFVPAIGKALNGAHRWIFLGPISFQPSEFMKIIAPLYFIHLYLKIEKMTLKQFYLIILRLFIPLFLILIEPDNGAVAIIMATMMALFILCRVKWLYWFLPVLFLVSLGGLAAFQMPHVKQRIRVYLHPEVDLLGKGHQPYQAKIATGSGRLFGRGVGESLQKLNYLPEARSDYIAAIYAEELGFIGVLFLVLLYLSIAYSGFHIALKAGTKGGFYVASVMIFLISFQAFLNLGVVSGLLPSKGTNLPFFSQGGSSLLANCIAIALIMSARRVKEREITWKKVEMT